MIFISAGLLPFFLLFIKKVSSKYNDDDHRSFSSLGINNCPDVSVFDMGLPDKADTEKRAQLTILDDGTRCVLMICSDGVWEFISSQQCKVRRIFFIISTVYCQHFCCTDTCTD